jgi:hypothetical protein
VTTYQPRCWRPLAFLYGMYWVDGSVVRADIETEFSILPLMMISDMRLRMGLVWKLELELWKH